jgi:dihydroneopterin aldolase
MSDLIRVVDLEVRAHIGVPKGERARKQKLLISLEMAVESFGPAAQNDDICLTVNYYTVAERIKELTSKKRPYRLLETLAERIATKLLDEFPIRVLKVEIKKFILPDARYVSVEIVRSAG